MTTQAMANIVISENWIRRATFHPIAGGSVAPPFTAFNNGQGEETRNTGKEIYMVWNQDDTVDAVLIFRGVSDPYGRVVDLPVTISAAAGGGTMKLCGPFQPPAWDQAASDVLKVDYSAGIPANIFIAVLQVRK